jgi:hypothetical protein
LPQVRREECVIPKTKLCEDIRLVLEPLDRDIVNRFFEQLLPRGDILWKHPTRKGYFGEVPPEVIKIEWDPHVLCFWLF